MAIRTLKIGMNGADVKALQKKLIELEWLVGEPDGIFGPKTQKAVIAFQKANNLVVDGKAGALTQRALFEGNIPVEPAPVPDGTIPPRPSSNAEAARIFGNSESAVSAQLAFCEVPDALKCFGLKNGKRGFTCHRLLVGQFQKVFNEIVAKGLADKIYSYEGCFNWRNIGGSSTRSLHSYAIAIDLNYEGNEWGDSTPAMDRGVVAIFKKHLFRWGGDYTGKKDGMHFEWYDRG